MAKPIHRNALQDGSSLLWYRIERILGQGGFGITYLALDSNLDQRVAIKEYLPMELAVREGDQSVHPVSQGHEDDYQWGLERFISEARTLARFDHPNIVRVLSVFEANNTAYMVMRYEQGTSLQQLLPRRGTLEESALMHIVLPILSGLAAVHAQGFIHRDIKPANLFIRDDGSPILLDFGSAREALNRNTRTLTSLVSPGFAPFEQYYSKSDRQGPWTDIYALGATLYRAAIGSAPADAVDRSEALIHHSGDPYISARDAGQGRYSQRFLMAIDRALEFRETDRPQSLDEWARMFEVPDVDAEAETALAPPLSPAAVAGPLNASRMPAAPDTASATTAAMPAQEPETEAFTPPVTDKQSGPQNLQLLIGPRQQYYRPVFDKIARSGKRLPLSWNWPACLFSFSWMNYRKLYGWAWLGYPLTVLACTMLVTALISILFYGAADVPEQVSLPVLLVLALLLPGLFANGQYYRHLRKLQARADRLQLPVPEHQAWLTRRGGVSRRAGVAAALISLLLLLGILGAGKRERTAVSVIEPKQSAAPAQNASAGTERRLAGAGLVAAAREDIRNLRLSTPPGNNALEKLRRLIELEPGNAEAPVLRKEILDRYRQLGASAARQGNLSKAAAYLQRAQEIDPGNPELAAAWTRLRVLELMTQGKQAAHNKDIKSAARYLRQAQKLAPDNPELKKLAARLKHFKKRSKGFKKSKD